MLDYKLFEEFNLSKDKLNLLSKFKELFLEYNQKVNLTSRKSIEEFDLKNLKDSLGVVNFVKFKKNENILDIGTGGGFPGIVLAIVFPESNFYLLDSNLKKIEWLKICKKHLDLKNIFLLNERVENLKFFEFDYIVSRAVTKTYILIELCYELLKFKGKAIFYKGNNWEKEQPNNKIETLLGVKFIKKHNWKLEDEIYRNFIFFEKIKENKYLDFKREYKKIINNDFFLK